MHSIHSRLPCLELRPYVRAYAQREIVGSAIDTVQPMPASLESIVELDFGNPPTVEYLNSTVLEATRTSIVGKARIAEAYASVTEEEALATAMHIWREINLVNLAGGVHRLRIGGFGAGPIRQDFLKLSPGRLQRHAITAVAAVTTGPGW